MEFTHLGRTGLQISRLCLGTMNFGPRTLEDDAYAIMDAAHGAGINFFDTANRYGTQPGETETILGNWFASGGGRRERTVLATKLYGEMGSWPNEGKLSALNIRRALDASLRRLQTDYIDLYQFHPSTGERRGRRSGRRSRWRCRRARSSTPAAATSPAGISPTRRPPPPGET